MKLRLFTFVCSLTLLFSIYLFAEQDVTLLWPEGKMPHRQEKQLATPCLEWPAPPAPDKRNGVCMLLIHGGAYNNNSSRKHIDWIVQRLTAQGITCVKLSYRIPRPIGLPYYQTAWEDGQRAMHIIRSQAEKRGFDPEKIGALGFSAGAHLTLLLATRSQTPAYAPIDVLDRIPIHLNWAIPIYPAYVLTDGLGIPNTTGGEGKDVQIDSVFQMDDKTCPMCFLHGSKDRYSPLASTRLYRELRKRKIPSELHLFADRPHGFIGNPDKGDDGTGYDHWFERIEEFLHQMEFTGKLAPAQPILSRFPDDRDCANTLKQELWPEGKIPNYNAETEKPFLVWYFPKERKTSAIQIVYSGGGYTGNTYNGREPAPVRRYLNAKGMTVVAMQYRTPSPKGLPKHLCPWQDLQRAIRIVRNDAPKYGLDSNRIGIMGFSAGGHLTLLGNLSSLTKSYEPIDELDKLPCNVQWGIAIYPAYVLSDGVNGPNAQGGNMDDNVINPEFAFDTNTCPMLFIHGDSDGYSAMNSVKVWEQLRRMGIGCDLHTLARRSHCFQFSASPATGSFTWLDRVWEFMNHKQYNR